MAIGRKEGSGIASTAELGESEEKGGISKYHSRWQKLNSLPLRHCHQQRISSLIDPFARRQLVAVVVLCLLFMAGEAVGGVLSNSLALFTDVLHLGSDLVSFVISLLAMWLANKPATRRMSFGYHRAEVLGALLSVFIIWLVSGILCYIAVERIMGENYKDVKPNEMLITASLGVLINFIMGFVLHSGACCGHAQSHTKFGHGHSHGKGQGQGNSQSQDQGQGHQDSSCQGQSSTQGHRGCFSNGAGLDYTSDKKSLLDARSAIGYDALLSVTEESRATGGCKGCSTKGGGRAFEYQQIDEKMASHQVVDIVAHESQGEDEMSQNQQKNINVRAAFIHVVGDIIQSIGVLIAALIIKFTDDLRFRMADPICTFLFSLLVLITTLAVMRDALLVIMEAAPRELSLDSLRQDLSTIDGVVAVHSLHVWALTVDRNALSVHLAIDNPHLHAQVLSNALRVTQDWHHFFSSTVQVEMYDEARSRECTECAGHL